MNAIKILKTPAVYAFLMSLAATPVLVSAALTSPAELPGTPLDVAPESRSASTVPLDRTPPPGPAFFPPSCKLPEWPKGAAWREEMGTVRLQFVVGAEGKVADIKVVRTTGYAGLDQAAVTALANCKFPRQPNSAGPVQTPMSIEFVWTIEGIRREVLTLERGTPQYRAWAERETAESQFGIARVYRTGLGLTRDDAEAAEWYLRAARRGHALAQYNLGLMYLAGEGVAKSDTEAASWMRLAAEQGHATAQFNLGVFYMNGQGVGKSASDAERWMRKAAEQGLAVAQVQLGDMYDQGRGVPADGAQSAAWYRKAADQGNVTGQYYLAQCYEYGVGVAQDSKAALAWYGKAAGQGHRESIEALARLKSG